MKKPNSSQSGFVYLEDIHDYIEKKFQEHQINANVPVANENLACQHNIALGHMMLLEDLKAWALDQVEANRAED